MASIAREKMSRAKGVTLLDAMIVAAIVGIVAAITLPRFI